MTIPALNTVKAKTLIIDDHPGLRHGLKRFVEMLGHEATAVGTVREALQEISCCESVLLDLNLPDGSGVDVLRYIRENRLPIRVAIISATDDMQLLNAANRLSPDAFFPKPSDLNALRGWLQS